VRKSIGYPVSRQCLAPKKGEPLDPKKKSPLQSGDGGRRES
jgi:hypothetical protein